MTYESCCFKRVWDATVQKKLISQKVLDKSQFRLLELMFSEAKWYRQLFMAPAHIIDIFPPT